MKFKYRLRNLRDEHNISGEELGKILNVGKSTVSMWENGKNLPTTTMLEKIASYFNVSTDYLLGKSDVRNNDDIDLDDIEYGLFTEIKDMSPEMKEQIISYARFLKNQNKK